MKSDFLLATAGPRTLGMVADEPNPDPIDVANYQLATVFYDFRVHPEAARQISDIVTRLNDQLKEMKNERS